MILSETYKKVHRIKIGSIHKTSLILQGYIENEVDMNELGTCKSKCSEYTYAEPLGCYRDGGGHTLLFQFILEFGFPKLCLKLEYSL